MTNSDLTPERAVRLLRAKVTELETQVLRFSDRGTAKPRPLDAHHALVADLALIAALLADFIEESQK